MNIRILSTLLVLHSLISCGKEEDARVFTEPITILQPSTNPANIVKGAPIKYDIHFSAGETIDSVKVFYQIDSLGVGFIENKKDSMIHYVDYPENQPKNEQSISGSFLPHTFPAIGKKIYLSVFMYGRTKKVDKRVPLIVN
jgi:hypothetical protein